MRNFLSINDFRFSDDKKQKKVRPKKIQDKNMRKFNIRKPKKQKKEKKKDKKAPLTFPWWFKIIAYLLSIALAIISIFFIIVKGISFGNDACTKWLTSVIISLFSSVFLTQPLQVVFFLFIYFK